MEQPDVTELPGAVLSSANDMPVPVASPASGLSSSETSRPCPTCGLPMQVNPPRDSNTTSAYVYALGRIEPRFPRLSVEKEYAQATGRAETAGLTDRQALQTVLSKPENRYLARQLCYVPAIEGLDTYILRPGDPADLQVLTESLRATPLQQIPSRKGAFCDTSSRTRDRGYATLVSNPNYWVLRRFALTKST